MLRLERIFATLVNIFAVLASLLLIAVMLATVIKIGLRSFFGIGIIGIDQLSGTAMVYMTFLGAVWVLRNNGHVAVDLVVSSVSVPTKRRLIMLHSTIGAIVCFVVSWYGFHVVQISLARGVMVASELEIPRAIGLIPVPIGAFLLGIEFLRHVLVAARGGFDMEGPLRQEA